MTSSIEIPAVDLAGDVSIPQFGLGVFQVPPENTFENVTTGIAAGYRHIDTAKAYGNEAEVGPGSSGLRPAARRLLHHHQAGGTTTSPENAVGALKTSLDQLENGPRRPLPDPLAGAPQDRYVETWQAMIEAQKAGLARAIGVSNFQPAHLRRIVDETGVTPAVNQIELHPYLPQPGLRREHADRGIVTEAWSPLAQGEVREDAVHATSPTAHRKRPRRSCCAGTSSSGTSCSRSR